MNITEAIQDFESAITGTASVVAEVEKAVNEVETIAAPFIPGGAAIVAATTAVETVVNEAVHVAEEIGDALTAAVSSASDSATVATDAAASAVDSAGIAADAIAKNSSDSETLAARVAVLENGILSILPLLAKIAKEFGL